MASVTINITETNSFITINYSTHSYSYSKNVTKIKLESDYVYIWEQHGSTKIHEDKILYSDVSVPVCASALILYLQLLTYLNNIPSLGILSAWGSYTNANIVDGTAGGFSVWCIEFHHLLSREMVNAIVYAGTPLQASPITITPGRADATHSDKLNYSTYDIGADPGITTSYWQVKN